jgi:hypothetical protein
MSVKHLWPIYLIMILLGASIKPLMDHINYQIKPLVLYSNKTVDKTSNFTRILEYLDLINPQNIVKNKSNLSINDLKIVTVFSLDHSHQAM